MIEPRESQLGGATKLGDVVDFDRYSPRALSRAFLRLHYLRRLWKSLQPKAKGERNGRQVLARVVREARRRDPGLRISTRTLQAWEQQYRAAEAKGLPGVAGLIDRHARPPEGVCLPAADSRRSPEAVAYFMAMRYGRNAPTIHKCHELTLAAAERCGWLWPTSAKTTATWIKRVEGETASTGGTE